MNAVLVHGGGEGAQLCEYANKTQSEFRFTQANKEGAIPLLLSGGASETPFEVDFQKGVTLYTRQSVGIAAYAGLPRELYLLNWAMLGLLQWRALAANPDLRPVDLIHPEDSRCLYAPQLFMEEYALIFESPHICKSCLRFYGALCTKEEVDAVNGVVVKTAEYGMHRIALNA